MYRRICLAALMLSVTAGSLPAQTKFPTVAPGQEVRVRTVGGGEVRGVIADVDSARLWIAFTRGDTVAIPRTAVAGMDVYGGMHSTIGRSALAGAMIGIGVGAFAGALAAAQPYSGDESAGELALQGAAYYGVTGVVIGALIGTKRRARWIAASWPTVVVAPAPAEGAGVAVGVHFRF